MGYRERESQTLKEDANRLIRRIRALPIFESDSNQAATGIQFWIEEVLFKLAAVDWADSGEPPVPVDEAAAKRIHHLEKQEEQRQMEMLEKQNA